MKWIFSVVWTSLFVILIACTNEPGSIGVSNNAMDNDHGIVLVDTIVDGDTCRHTLWSLDIGRWTLGVCFSTLNIEHSPAHRRTIGATSYIDELKEDTDMTVSTI